MKSRIKHTLIYQILILFGVFLLIGETSFAQNSGEPDTPSTTPQIEQLAKTAAKLSIKLETKDIEVGKSEMAANQLTLQNNTDKPVVFYVDLNLPPSWKTFGINRLFQIMPGKSMVIPLRLLPMSLLGSTRFFIGVNIVEENGDFITSDFFYVSSYKVVDWDMSILQGNKIYFKNGENQSEFDLDILNKGNYGQDLVLQLRGVRDGLILKDKDGKVISSPKYSFSLASLEDTSFHFGIETTAEKRNFRTISLQDYRPNFYLDEKSYSLYLNSSEAKSSGKHLQKKGTKVDFVRLSNEKRANQFSGPVLPLIAEANIQNILSDNPFMNLMLRGFQRFEDGSNLVYFSQFNYNSNFYSEQFIRNASWYAGYFTDNYTIEGGNVSGSAIGLPTIGRGIKGSYRVYDKHWIGAFYVRSPTLFNGLNRESFGAFYNYRGGGILKGSAGYAHANDFLKKRKTDAYNARATVRLAKSHTLSLVGAVSNRSTEDSTRTLQVRQGYLVGLGYSGKFFKSKLSTNISGRYQNPTFGLSDNERKILNARFQYKLNDVSNLLFNSTTNENDYLVNRGGGLEPVNSFFMYNYFSYNRNTSFGNIQPYAYAQASDVLTKRVNSFGVGTRFSNYIFDKNVLWATNVSGGYNKAYFVSDLPLYFNFKANSLIRIRTLTGILGYFYGPTSAAALESALLTKITPEFVRASVSHQHVFKNEHFVMQNSLNYSYQNQVRNSRINYFPELFYFTNSGWRFSVNCNFSYSFSKSRPGISAQGTPTTVVEETTRTNSNVRVGASVRKEFGIPIPFTKKRNFTKEFIVFYDLNGNSKKEKDEPAIENVVIQLGDHEIISNKEGHARLIYLTGGNYSYKVFSLEELEGWFPNIPDSVSIMGDGIEYIPYVKGVKLFGQVVVDREKLAAFSDKPMDLANIKITALNEKDYYTLTDFDGKFEFYLPNGSYSVSIDEKILGSKYRLVKNNIQVFLNEEVDGVFITFMIVERKRKVTRKVFGKGARKIISSDDQNTGQNNADSNRINVDDLRPKGEQSGAGTTGDIDNGAGTNATNDNSTVPENGSGTNGATDTENGTGTSTDDNSSPSENNAPNGTNGGQDAGSNNENNSDNEDDTSFNPSDLPDRVLNAPNDDNVNPINTPIDLDKIGFKVDLGSFTESVPTSVLNRLIKMGFSNQKADENGALRLTSESYKTEAEANQFRQKAIEAGFNSPAPVVLGEYDGAEMSAEKARGLYEKGQQQQGN